MTDARLIAEKLYALIQDMDYQDYDMEEDITALEKEITNLNEDSALYIALERLI